MELTPCLIPTGCNGLILCHVRQKYIKQYFKSNNSIFQEEYVEYSRCGTVLKGQEKVAMRSVYEEDAYPQNHTVSRPLY